MDPTQQCIADAVASLRAGLITGADFDNIVVQARYGFCPDFPRVNPDAPIWTFPPAPPWQRPGYPFPSDPPLSELPPIQWNPNNPNRPGGPMDPNGPPPPPPPSYPPPQQVPPDQYIGITYDPTQPDLTAPQPAPPSGGAEPPQSGPGNIGGDFGQLGILGLAQWLDLLLSGGGAFNDCATFTAQLTSAAYSLLSYLQSAQSSMNAMLYALMGLQQNCGYSGACLAELNDHQNRINAAVNEMNNRVSQARQLWQSVQGYDCFSALGGTALLQFYAQQLRDFTRAWVPDSGNTAQQWNDWLNDFQSRCPCGVGGGPVTTPWAY